MTMRNGEDPNEFMDDPKKRIEIIRRKVYQDELKTLLPRMLHLGFFEQENWNYFVMIYISKLFELFLPINVSLSMQNPLVLMCVS